MEFNVHILVGSANYIFGTSRNGDRLLNHVGWSTRNVFKSSFYHYDNSKKYVSAPRYKKLFQMKLSYIL